jgi:hypothetical protein
MYTKIAPKKRVGKPVFGTNLIHSPWGKVLPIPGRAAVASSGEAGLSILPFF